MLIAHLTWFHPSMGELCTSLYKCTNMYICMHEWMNEIAYIDMCDINQWMLVLGFS